MSDEGGEKTEDATPKKLEEAHEEGRVPKSQELTSAMLLMGLTLVMTVMIPDTADSLKLFMGSALMRLAEPGLTGEAMISLARAGGWKVLMIILPIALTMAGISIAISAIQARGILSAKPLAFKWERISPMQNAKRVFGKQAIVELLKSLLKVGIVGFAIYTVVTATTIDSIIVTSQQSPIGFLSTVKRHVITLLMSAGIAYIFLAIADYLWQNWQFAKQHRMSKQEVRQEMKNAEGDPLLKQRMRSIARNIARKQMFRNVPTADVVIVNPTHRAIALEYDPAKAPAPTVVAMGERKVAERIKKLALENNVPVIENKPLAVALIGSARVGMMIPADLYTAVAEVLAFVIQHRQSAQRRKSYAVASQNSGNK